MDNPFDKKDEVVNPLAKTTEPAKVTTKLEKKEETKVLTEKQRILEEYGGLESNVPVTSRYWKLKK